jgi:hypothetical protein
LQVFRKVSNNEAEYEALLHGLRLAASLGIKRLLVYDDSAMVINQVNKCWDRNKENMDTYCLEVCKLENKFYSLEFHHVVRDNNVATDVLSKLGCTHAQVPASVFVHELHAPSIPEPAPTTTDPTSPPAGQEVMMIDVDWRQPFIDYIREQKVPTNKNLAEQLIRRAKSYVLVGDKLYRRGATSEVLMKCVPQEEGKDILEEIHKGICGNHVSSRTLVSKAFRRAFHWPTALGDAEELSTCPLSTGPQPWVMLRSHQKVPRVPVLRQATARPGLQASHHTTNMAFRLLGARHDWTSSDYARRIQQSSGGHRQAQQVDRSQAGHLPGYSTS